MNLGFKFSNINLSGNRAGNDDFELKYEQLKGQAVI